MAFLSFHTKKSHSSNSSGLPLSVCGAFLKKNGKAERQKQGQYKTDRDMRISSLFTLDPALEAEGGGGGAMADN